MLIMVAIVLPLITSAQLKVGYNSNVVVGDSSSSVTKFSVFSSANSSNSVLISGNDMTLLQIKRSGDASFGNDAVEIDNTTNSSHSVYGVYSISTNTSTSGSAGSVGLYGKGNGLMSGRNIGVLGSINYSYNGAGIYGTTGSYANTLDGKYAGYFDGNVKVTGTVNGMVISSSDARLKENIQTLEDTYTEGSSLDKLEMLTPIAYNYKHINNKRYPLSEGESEVIVDEPNQVMKKTHFGLLAQELQEVFPDLVYENDNGYLSINYTELIPVLIQSIKELKIELDIIKSSTEANRSSFLREGEVRGGGDETSSIGDDSLPFSEGLGVGSSMDQNVPNPFSEKTDIAIFLPESVQTATLYIYDLSGKQIEQHPVEGRGNTMMTIHAESMDAGMYVYSLIADKKVVTTRKMIVVK